MENLEQMADNYLLYNDEAEVTNEPEITKEVLEELISEEIGKQLTPEKVETTLSSLKDEL